MTKRISIYELIKRLEQQYGSHTNAGKMLGYSHSSGYRRARRAALKKGTFPPQAHRLALMLVCGEQGEVSQSGRLE